MSFSDATDWNQAVVFQDQARAGLLSRTPHGSVFQYDDSYKGKDISFHLPVSQRIHEVRGTNLHPFFAGLLPEGYRLKALIQNIKTSADDLMSLILATGQDTIGDISILPESFELRHHHPTLDLNQVTQVSFDQLFEKSVAYDQGFSEMSIAGVQNKISAGVISFPIRGQSTAQAYILKLNPKEFPLLVENENFFMNLAAQCGIDVPKVKILKDQKQKTGLLVERFDRVYRPKNKKLLKIHQEDACQFLNRYPADKYRLSYRDVAQGLEQWCTAPIVEVAKLIQWIIFSYVICNGDLHAKNISVFVDPETQHVRLTPAYDLLSTLPYGDQALALHIEGKKDNLNRKMFYQFGAPFGVNSKVIDSFIEQIRSVVTGSLNDLPRIGFKQKKTIHLSQTIEKRILDLA